ncbi:unannotated protein [freshwater metagenome]|uniref:Unannotated protein n=1 Tax=freshwater metagenome TaxID=449393 RepID=A0A6J7DAY2_9ZZZZ|nr:hypothetical protein [Actinomycetota bacterium]
MSHAGRTAPVAITAAVSVSAVPDDSLETLIFRAARAALEAAGLDRTDLDGVVLAASDQTDGRAISSMLTSGPAGAYLNDEINTASSPGHALALGCMQILSGVHNRLLISSWGKSSESPKGSQPAERLSAEPFFERDGGSSALAAAAMQAERHRAADPARGAHAAAIVAARNHGERDLAEIEASPVVASPLRALELPTEIDTAFSIMLECPGRIAPLANVSGVGWCSDSSRIAERDLVGLPHLVLAGADAYARAGLGPADIGSWHLHDYTPDAEMLAYAALGLCPQGGGIDLALSGAVDRGGQFVINPDGGSVRGEAPFGGVLGKVVDAIRAVSAAGGPEHALAHLTTGFAGQFQTVAIVERSA